MKWGGGENQTNIELKTKLGKLVTGQLSFQPNLKGNCAQDFHCTLSVKDIIEQLQSYAILLNFYMNQINTQTF